jgi:hypothetical protein
MEHKKVIILVAAEGAGYQDLVQAIRETWGSSKREGFEILYYYGFCEDPGPAPGQCIQRNDMLFCGTDWRDILTRNEIAFTHIYNNYDFDYLFRCCAGSYISQKKMDEFLEDKPKTTFYCGGLVNTVVNIGEIIFASGSGLFLSKDLVKLLIDNPSGFRCQWCDDVSFGAFFTEKGIQVTNAPRQDFYDGVIKDLDPNIYHYHFRHNISIMREIHQKLILEEKETGDKK